MISRPSRPCYMCGKIGHYAENCESTERLCYNCGKPGHESNACSEERSNEGKQCYNCKGMGHVTADCPTPLPIKCYSCGQVGHVQRNCPNPSPTRANASSGPGRSGPSPRGAFSTTNFRGGPSYTATSSRPSGVTCYNCGEANHFARDCQLQAAQKCYACGETGHISKTCPSNAGKPQLDGVAGKTCYACGQVGHISKTCPTTTNSTAAVGAGAAGVGNTSANKNDKSAPSSAVPVSGGGALLSSGVGVADAASQPVGTPISPAVQQAPAA